tara:strand:+ start:187 stop:429 length:243 start_codon:yes stop_codon:yes gene_type:complete
MENQQQAPVTQGVNDNKLLERQFMNEMVTPKMRTMEADNNDYNNEIEEYIKKLKSTMWKGLVFAVIVGITAILIWVIVHK